MINNQKKDNTTDAPHSEVVETHVLNIMYELHKALGCANRIIKQSLALEKWLLDNKHNL